jgi:uncharacterized RDD family membrane protein YckC
MLMDPSAPPPPPLPSEPPPTAPEFQKAGFWRRVGACLIDSVILGIVGWILGFFFTDAFIRMGGWERLIGVAVAALYFVPLNSRLGGGQTVGKRAFGIRVVSKTGSTLGLARSFARSLVLMLPHFLNGASLPMWLLTGVGGILIAEAVFGLGLSIVYLIVFNARTRQSLHDLIVGSYVVRLGSEAADKPKTWPGHYVVVGLILVAAGVLPSLLGSLMQHWLPQEVTAAYEAIQQEPEVAVTQVLAGQTMFWDATKGQRFVTGVTVNVRLNRRVENHDAEANKLAKILLEKYPGAATKDSISIMMAEGYDLGIASWFYRQGFNFSPDQWRQRLDPSAPTPTPTPSPTP